MLNRQEKYSLLLIILTAFITSLAVAETYNTSTSFQWKQGDFNASSQFRNNTSGNLGIGYRNGNSSDQLIGFWRFDRASSTSPRTYQSYSGETGSATLKNSPQFDAKGIMSTSGIGLDGNNEHIELPQLLAGRQQFTVSFWADIKSYDDGREFSSGGNGASQVLIWGDNTDQLEFIVWDGSSSARISSGENPTGWTHVVGTWDGSTAKLFANGQQIGSTSFTGDGTVGDPGGPMFLGRDSSGSYSDSTIDEVRIYKRSLTQQEIQKLYFHRQNNNFKGEYSKYYTLNQKEVPINLEVNSENIGGQNQSYFKINNSANTQKVQINSSTQTENYSLNFEEGGNTDLKINLSTPDTRTTPIINNYTLHTNYKPETGQPQYNYNPLEAGQTLNATIEATSKENDIETVKINLTAPDNTKKAENAEMTQNPSNSSEYYYTTTINNQTSNFGQWKTNITAQDQYTKSETNNTFQVVEQRPPKWRNQVQQKDNISASASNKLTAEGFDQGLLTEAILATNETGTFQNKTTYSSPIEPDLSGIWAQTEFTWDNNSVKGEAVAWKIYYGDSLGQYNSTATKTFYVRSEDNVPPEITIFNPENTSINKKNIDLEVKADETIDTWQYNLDNNGNQTFTPNTTLNNLNEGGHTVTAYANDTAGNTGQNTRQFTVDTEKPRTRLLTDTVVGNLTQGNPANITLEIRDDTSGVQKAILATNETGIFQNKTGIYDSPENYSNKSNQWIDKRFNWDNNTFIGKLGYKVYVRDAAGNWKETKINTFQVSEPNKETAANVENQGQWRRGTFSGTTADRADNSGNLGLGYLNRSTAELFSPEKNLLSLYRFDKNPQGDGGTVIDYTETQYNGQTKGGVTTGTTGIFSTNSFEFDGSNDWLNLSSTGIASRMSGKGFTWAGWLKTGGGDKDAVISANTASQGNNLMLYLNNNKLSLYDGAFNDANTNVADNNWHFFAVTLEDSTGQVNYYVDGQQETNSFTTSARVNSNDLISIGQEFDSGGASDYFPGKLDEIQLYNQSLTSNQIKQLYINQNQFQKFKGNYTYEINLNDDQKPFKLNVKSENIDQGEANLTVTTTKGEKDNITIGTGTNDKNYTLDFQNKGGNATVKINLSSQEKTQTPIINSFKLRTIANKPPKFDLKLNNITINDQEPVEGQNVTVSTNVSNEGDTDLEDTFIQLNVETFNGSFNDDQTEQKLVSLNSGQSKEIKFSWIANPGRQRIKVTADPQDDINETNETNNNLSRIEDIPSYQVYYGGEEAVVELGKNSNKLSAWFSNSANSTLYFSDTDTNYVFNELEPLNGSNDLSEADQALNLTGHPDSLAKTYDKNNDGDPDYTKCLEIGSQQRCQIPFDNSTNTENFQTGILYQQENNNVYNGTQPLIFITQVNNSKTGKYGEYDYEIKVPFTLETQEPSQNTVSVIGDLK